ncbi:DedA family protein, partial [Erwinia amylovora]|nr:DedA family protein [Erwinia amylovora]
TFTLQGGVAAHEGMLRYIVASQAAMCGGIIGDCAQFFIGRHNGETNLRRIKHHRQPVAPAKRQIRIRPVLFVIGVRIM